MKFECIMGLVFKNVVYFIGYFYGDNEYIELFVYIDGFIVVEVEFMIEINCEIMFGSIDIFVDLFYLICYVYIGVEIVSSLVKDLNDYGFIVIIVDFGNNYGMVVGVLIEDW